jgi:dUTP pyrophosphatase
MKQKHESIDIPISLEGDAELPVYSSADASGADVRAHIEEDIQLKPGERILIPTGISFAIPHGYEIQVRPRSGMALKHGITVLNSPGTIDADYRGELGVILINLGSEIFTIKPGMRIAQIVVQPVFQANFILQKQFAETQRGAGGFGHTGAH